MRASMISAAVVVAAAAAGMASPVSAAAPSDWGLNGTFTATSNGEWAATNDVFHNEQSVRSIWTISTQCSYPTECTGTVTSDLGWTAPIYQTGGEWYVKRVVPNWMPCFDGSAAPGMQVYRFHRSSPGGDMTDPTSNMLAGLDATTGEGGACGRSLPLYISMPFKLVKQG